MHDTAQAGGQAAPPPAQHGLPYPAQGLSEPQGPRYIVAGLGHDVVSVQEFSAQCAAPESEFLACAFSVREIRQSQQRSAAKGDKIAAHLAARWAGKEAFLKAWCEALSRCNGGTDSSAGEAGIPAPGTRTPYTYPYTVDNFPWREVEVVSDSRGVPHITLSAEMEQYLSSSLGVRTGNGEGGIEGREENSSGEAGCEVSSYIDIHVSLSHDGPVASAVAMILEITGTADTAHTAGTGRAAGTAPAAGNR